LNKKYSEFINFFDKILLDAPCSAEGRFDLSNTRSYKFWNKNKKKEMARHQKGLILNAINMLKPGGILVYSTCTINTMENEEVVDWLMYRINKSKSSQSEFISESRIKVLPINLNLPNIMHGFTKIDGKELNKQIKNTVRIVPNELFNAFFIAQIQKY